MPRKMLGRAVLSITSEQLIGLLETRRGRKKRERERKENKIKDRQWEILFLDVTAWAVQRRVCERLPDGQTDGACPGTPVASHIRLRDAQRKAFSVEPILTWAQRGVLLPKGDGGTKLSVHQRTASEGTNLLPCSSVAATNPRPRGKGPPWHPILATSRKGLGVGGEPWSSPEFPLRPRLWGLQIRFAGDPGWGHPGSGTGQDSVTSSRSGLQGHL